MTPGSHRGQARRHFLVFNDDSEVIEELTELMKSNGGVKK